MYSGHHCCPQVLWEQFSANALNAALRAEVTATELEMFRLDNSGALTTEVGRCLPPSTPPSL